MLCPRYLTTLCTSTACYRNSCTLFTWLRDTRKPSWLNIDSPYISLKGARKISVEARSKHLPNMIPDQHHYAKPLCATIETFFYARNWTKLTCEHVKQVWSAINVIAACWCLEQVHSKAIKVCKLGSNESENSARPWSGPFRSYSCTSLIGTRNVSTCPQSDPWHCNLVSSHCTEWKSTATKHERISTWTQHEQTTKKQTVASVRERTTPTERTPLFGEVSSNFYG
jgi:hypothetical protein